MDLLLVPVTCVLLCCFPLFPTLASDAHPFPHLCLREQRTLKAQRPGVTMDLTALEGYTELIGELEEVFKL